MHVLTCLIVFEKVSKFQTLCKNFYSCNRNIKTQSHAEQRGDDNADANKLFYGTVDLSGNISLVSSRDIYHESPYHFKH